MARNVMDSGASKTLWCFLQFKGLCTVFRRFLQNTDKALFSGASCSLRVNPNLSHYMFLQIPGPTLVASWHSEKMPRVGLWDDTRGSEALSTCNQGAGSRQGAGTHILNQPQAGTQWRTARQHLRTAGRKPHACAHLLAVFSSYEYSWDSRKEARIHAWPSTNRTQAPPNSTSPHPCLQLV